jgi:AraC-like DNA-binding protein/mannose-6-phosphate isomerase-like protein (cupin superfamily)
LNKVAVFQQPWHQSEKADPVFPVLLRDNTFKSFSYHWHELIELVYIFKGNISVSVGSQTWEAFQGDIIVIDSGVVHGFFNGSPDVNTCIIRAAPELFENSLVDLRDWAIRKFVFSRKTFIPADKNDPVYCRLKKILLEIRQEFYRREDGFRLAVKANLYEMALIFLRKIPRDQSLPQAPYKRCNNHRTLERVFAFIQANSSNCSITLDDAAEAAALNKFYFTRFFKEQTGETYHVYLSKVRVSRAEEYLIETDTPIADIATLCGFASLKTFNRIFKSYAGSSPSEYRSGNKNGYHGSVRNLGS